MPSGLTEISSRLFFKCHSLTNFTVPPAVRRLRDHAFGDCHRLASISLSPSVTRVDHHCFSNCAGLITAILPPTVSLVGDGVFSDCHRLSRVICPLAVLDKRERVVHNCPRLNPRNAMTFETSKARRAIRLLAFWSVKTHDLNLDCQQQWVLQILLMITRLSNMSDDISASSVATKTLPSLPMMMWRNVLGFIPRREMNLVTQ
jgi:hypothetical protein